MDRSVGWQANRPKAIIALNAETVEVRSGQAEAPLGLTTGAYSYEQAFQVNRELSSHAPQLQCSLALESPVSNAMPKALRQCLFIAPSLKVFYCALAPA